MNKPVILKNHHSDKSDFRVYDVIAYGDYVMTATWEFWKWKSLSKQQLDKKLKEIKMSQEQWQQILDAIEKGEGNATESEDLDFFALTYAKKVELDPNMRQIVLNAKETSRPYEWYRVVDSTDKEMRQRVIDDNDPEYAWSYLVAIDGDDEDMRQIVLDGNDPHWILAYCHCVRYDKEMYDKLLELKDPYKAYEWCQDIGIDQNMRQIVLDAAKAGDNLAGGYYIQYVDLEDEEMKQAVYR